MSYVVQACTRKVNRAYSGKISLRNMKYQKLSFKCFYSPLSAFGILISFQTINSFFFLGISALILISALRMRSLLGYAPLSKKLF